MKANIHIPAFPAAHGYKLHLRKIKPDPVSIAMQKHLPVEKVLVGIEYSTLIQNGRQIQMPTPSHAQDYLVNYYLGRSAAAVDFEVIIPGFFLK